jgi:DNA primase
VHNFKNNFMEIKDIKNKLSLTDVLKHYHFEPDRNQRLCCPWHEDKTPSLQIYPKTNTWTCFSSNCNAGNGDAIDFIMKIEKISKHEALIKAKEMIGYVIEEREEKYTDLFNQMRAELLRSKKALSYMTERNLDAKTIEAGYNSYQSNYKQVQNCIVFPLKDKQDNIVSLYGRSITDLKGSNHYYTKNRKGLYPYYPSEDTATIIITEAVIDAATLQSKAVLPYGSTVLALYGTNGWNEEHTAAIKSLAQLTEVIFFMDGDEAGRKAVEPYAALLKVMKPEVIISQVNTPEGEDVNSLVQSHDEGILQHLIESRKSIGSIEHRSIDAEPMQSMPPMQLNTENDDYITTSLEGIKYTIIGGISLYPMDRLKVTLKMEKIGSNRPMHSLRQNIDLYQDDIVEKMARKIAERLEMGSTKVHESMLQLTAMIEQYRQEQIEARKIKEPEKRKMTEKEARAAHDFLSKSDLLKRTNEAIGKSGVVGENNNRLLMYLVFTSRLREQPLHIISLGGSGTGKTYLQEKIAELIPDDEKLEITAISENALYYFDRKELKNKLVLIEDLDGASDDKVLFAIRELQSKKRISKTIPMKDNKGNLKTITLQVEGPISLAGTTTRERLYEDNANRSLLIYLDNNKEHREQILAYQRALSAGKINRDEEEQTRQKLQDVQSVLKPIKVINPFAEMLILPDSVFKPLRTNSHYLHFIETITFYHQYQRPHKTNETTGEAYIETTIEDIEAANTLLKDVLLAKSDELTNACRSFLELIKTYMEIDHKTSFYSYDLRMKYRMAPTTLNRHLKELHRYSYIKIASGSKSKGFEYELEHMNEIENLQAGLQNAFDVALEKIKLAQSKAEGKKVGEPVNHQWPTNGSGLHKEQEMRVLDTVNQ